VNAHVLKMKGTMTSVYSTRMTNSVVKSARALFSRKH
jgi:hypothetical protein